LYSIYSRTNRRITNHSVNYTTGSVHCPVISRLYSHNYGAKVEILSRKIKENQIICGCMKVTVQDMINAIKKGARSFEEVQAVTKVGTGCGNCVESNKALFAHLIK